jgi:sugar lactone lactonase YvrE
VLTSGQAVLELDAHAQVGESPVWSEPEQVLLWVDIWAGLVHRFDPASKADRAHAAGMEVGSVAPRAGGGVVLAVEAGFALVDLDGDAPPEMIAAVEADVAENRMNDGKCDSAGRFWAGTMSRAMRQGGGALYRLDPDRRVTTVLRGVSVSNGIDWSPDDRTMYYVDSPTRRVDAFDFEPVSGALSGRRSFIEFGAGEGNPDGLTVDSAGYLWVAMWDGWAVRRFTPDGRLDRVVELPVSRVTSCSFGGAGYSVLYVTTAVGEATPQDLLKEPLAGGLFSTDPGVTGRPPHAYLG